MEFSESHGISIGVLKKLFKLKSVPISHRPFRIIHELRIDALILIVVLLLIIAGVIFFSLPLWVKVNIPVNFLFLIFIYMYCTEYDTSASMEKDIPFYAKAISEIIPTKVVIFGHLHQPRLIPIKNGVTFLDTGSWTPGNIRRSFRFSLKNYLIIECAESGDVGGVRLESWEGEVSMANKSNADRMGYTAPVLMNETNEP